MEERKPLYPAAGSHTIMFMFHTPLGAFRVQLAAIPLHAEDRLKYGQPACTGQILDKKFFVVWNDSNYKVPAWVGVRDHRNAHLYALRGNSQPRTPDFIQTSCLVLILAAKAKTPKVRVAPELYMFKISMIVT